MFIVAKKKFRIKRADGSLFLIPKEYMGEIPGDVASHWLMQSAIKSGSIAASGSSADKSLDKAVDQAAEAEKVADIRPDAKETEAEGKEPEVQDEPAEKEEDSKKPAKSKK